MPSEEERGPEENAGLTQAILDGEAATRAALAAGGDPNAENELGDCALFTLINAMRGNDYLSDEEAFPILRALLEGGADPMSEGNTSSMEPYDSASALHCAVERGWAECAKALLAAGADPCAEDTLGAFPFDAIAYGEGSEKGVSSSLSIAKALIEHGADVNDEGHMRVPPLILALLESNEALARGLLEMGADPNWVSRGEERGGLHAVAGASISENSGGWRSAVGEQVAMAVMLIEAGADPRQRDCDGRMALDFAQGELRGTLLAIEEAAQLGEGVGARAPAASKSPRV